MIPTKGTRTLKLSMLGREPDSSGPISIATGRSDVPFIELIDSLGSMLRSVYGESADATSDSRFAAARFVTLLDVLEHQEDDVQFIGGLVAKMEPGSLLLLTVPALPKLWSPWDEALGHFRRYTRSSLLERLNGLPLTTIEVSYLFPEMLLPGYLRTRRGRSGERTWTSRSMRSFPTSLDRSTMCSMVLARHPLPCGGTGKRDPRCSLPQRSRAESDGTMHGHFAHGASIPLDTFRPPGVSLWVRYLVVTSRPATFSLGTV